MSVRTRSATPALWRSSPAVFSSTLSLNVPQHHAGSALSKQQLRHPPPQALRPARDQHRLAANLDSLRLPINHLDLKHRRPLLPRYKQPIMLGVIRDAVQHRILIDPLARRHQPGQINPADHMPIPRRYPRNPVRMPHIGINLASAFFLRRAMYSNSFS